MARLGFHNIGKNLTPGLIVMSLDDGTGLADLDPAYDAIVVVINGTDHEQTHKVATASGFSLHPVQQQSVDAELSAAAFVAAGADGEFVVPAYTAAVFVKAQQGAQGQGLKADATMGAADIAPYGLTTVFVRGSINGWGEVDAFTYAGDGVYSTRINIAAGDYEFKVASGDWSTVDFGAQSGQVDVLLDGQKTLTRSGANMKLNLAKTSSYVFTLDASVPTAPVLTVTEYVPFAATKVYVRGGMNGWGEVDQLSYDGASSYSVTLDLAAGDYEFKVASADWSTVDFGGGADGQNVTLATDKVLARSGSNLKLNLAAAGRYRFSFNATDTAAPVLNVSKL